MRTALSLALLLAAPAAAQQAPAEPTTHQRAIAAGYKALMTCGATFNARMMDASRDPASIAANEMTGIYSDYDALAATFSASVQPDRVSVAWDKAMPPRVAVSRAREGCVVLPIGADPALRLPASRTPTPPSAGSWPRGDGDPGVAPPPALSDPFDRAFAGHYGEGSNTTGLIVVRNGRLAAERYAPGFGPRVPQRTWSVAKSIAGTMIGAAAHRKLVSAGDPAPVPEWQAPGDPRAAITLDHLLRMASGLHSDTAGNRTDAVYFGGVAVTEETVAWPLSAQPGTRFRYANNDTLLAIRALRARIGRDDFAQELLFDPIAMRHTIAEQDWRGNYILSSQVWSTARDLARLGQFWLDDGVWQGKRILPVGWMTYMTTPSGPQPERGPGYGATLWLFGPAQGLPAGSYAAQGNRGQYVMVIPSRRLVIVRRGEDPGGARFDIARFAADIAAATAR